MYTAIREIKVSEGRWFSWKGFRYYLKHRKELTKETIARILTTRNDKGYSSSSIFRVIKLTLEGVYWIERNGERIYDITPLTILKTGDIIVCVSFMACRYWGYDGKEAIFIEER